MISHEGERLDFTTVPQSQGITTPAYIVLVIGLIGIFAMGGLSMFMSGYGHMWMKDGTSRTTMRMCLEQDDSKCAKGTAPQH